MIDHFTMNRTVQQHHRLLKMFYPYAKAQRKTSTSATTEGKFRVTSKMVIQLPP